MLNLRHIVPFFIVANIKDSISFYIDRLGFELQYLAPDEDPFLAIVGRDDISIMLKAVAENIRPSPNSTRHEWAAWDASIYAEDPDTLYAEYDAAGILFRRPLRDDSDGLRGFEVTDADGYVLFFGRPIGLSAPIS